MDVLIHNAGVTHFSRAVDTDPSTIRRVMDVNFLGAITLNSYFLPSLIERKGAITVLSSVAGFAPLYGRAGYSASKHALHGYFDSLRSEVGEQGVSVMMVCPSFIATQEDPSNEKKIAADGTARPGLATQTAGSPMTAQEVAEQIIQSIVSGKRQLALGRVGRLSYWISRFFPTVFERMMVKNVRAEFDRG